ncbi:uncharacterized protein LOC130614384 [Hydractinia symbiolongicarpus]|uniref:uncharacterized protein LOC130614384 n=1 Tax=Hydractinia symbiolongicarpus TaxID=13093 RepID=UPI002549DEB8|nr:uncharacterized protein LOC130614384 [Hydractinia symbiolongicarpus]
MTSQQLSKQKTRSKSYKGNNMLHLPSIKDNQQKRMAIYYPTKQNIDLDVFNSIQSTPFPTKLPEVALRRPVTKVLRIPEASKPVLDNIIADCRDVTISTDIQKELTSIEQLTKRKAFTKYSVLPPIAKKLEYEQQKKLTPINSENKNQFNTKVEKIVTKDTGDSVPTNEGGKRKRNLHIATSLPKTPPAHYRNKDLSKKAESEFCNKMLKWVKFKGRRNAICFEMDEIYKELSTIIKHNLLIQHLEEIWMC